MTLHSNLVLFKFNNEDIPPLIKDFSLHSNLVLFKWVGYTEKDTRDKIFTFQSGSIQMMSLDGLLLLRLNFTFQSGSIQMVQPSGQL